MNKVKLLSIICVAMLIANIVLVWFLLSTNADKKHTKGPKNKVIKALNLSETQIAAYENLIVWHKSEVKKTEKEMMELKYALYETLNNSNSLKADSIITKIGNLQVAIEKIHYTHFKDIEKLCTTEQKPAFKVFTKEITNLFPRTRNRQH